VEIPSWWLVVSGLFFVINAVFFVVLIFGLMKVLELSKELKPKVDRISDRLDSISAKVDDIATNVQSTVKTVGEKTSTGADSLAMIAQLGSANFGRYAPALATIGTIVKAVQMIRASGLKFPSMPRRRRSSK
jgi:hypothetical protein